MFKDIIPGMFYTYPHVIALGDNALTFMKKIAKNGDAGRWSMAPTPILAKLTVVDNTTGEVIGTDSAQFFGMFVKPDVHGNYTDTDLPDESKIGVSPKDGSFVAVGSGQAFVNSFNAEFAEGSDTYYHFLHYGSGNALAPFKSSTTTAALKADLADPQGHNCTVTVTLGQMQYGLVQDFYTARKTIAIPAQTSVFLVYMPSPRVMRITPTGHGADIPLLGLPKIDSSWMFYDFGVEGALGNELEIGSSDGWTETGYRYVSNSSQYQIGYMTSMQTVALLEYFEDLYENLTTMAEQLVDYNRYVAVNADVGSLTTRVEDLENGGSIVITGGSDMVYLRG